MVDAATIREHMEIIGADGTHVGTVDKIEGDRIKLTKNDRAAGGGHHWVALELVATVEANVVRLSTTAENAVNLWEEDR